MMKKIFTLLLITLIACNSEKTKVAENAINADSHSNASEKNTKVNAIIVPDFTANDINGKAIKLSDFYKKNKVTLIDFWASWCGPCREENPNIVSTYQKYHNKGFEIISVSLDKTKDKWLAAIAEDKLTWTHVSELKYWSSDIAAAYGVQSIPTNFLVDSTGKLLAAELRGIDLPMKLKEFLDK